MAKTTTIAGNTFLFTGKLTEFTREDAEAHVEAEGGKVLSGVSAKLNYLVVGEDAGSKLKKAEALGTVTILHEKEFLKMMQSGSKKSVSLKKAVLKKVLPPKVESKKTEITKNASAKKIISQKKVETSKNTTKKTASSKETSSIENVTIGKQIWSVKNLDVTHFRNGDPIPEARTKKEWKKAGDKKQPAWCLGKFGKLYNWYAVNDSRNLSPAGWHIPNDKEWNEMIDFLGGNKVAGKKMKSNITWNSPPLSYVDIIFGIKIVEDKSKNKNSSGFSGLPGCFRDKEGGIFDPGTGWWWSSNELTPELVFSRTLTYRTSWVYNQYSHKSDGVSVRLIKD